MDLTSSCAEICGSDVENVHFGIVSPCIALVEKLCQLWLRVRMLVLSVSQRARRSPLMDLPKENLSITLKSVPSRLLRQV
jgi:hypothetical protein